MPALEGWIEIAKLSLLGRREFCDQLIMSAMGMGGGVMEPLLCICYFRIRHAQRLLKL